MNEFLTYEAFGAVGDGITDDMPAIVRTHDEANRLGLPVQAKEGATYYISPKNATATVKTSVDWTGAKFIIDDRDCENRNASIFLVVSDEAPVPLSIPSLVRGQTTLENPTGRDLHVIVCNANHLDYIRFGLNQNNGTARRDNFILRADGTLSSAVSFDFDEVTSVTANPIPAEKLTLTGGEFTTIANRAESRYNYHARNIRVNRSNVEISGFTHLVTGEIDHGAPYGGFLDISNCADVDVHDCVFTGHYIYNTIGSAGKPVSMGSYDISCGSASNLSFRRCTQTTDIMDRRYWGLIGSNFCRDLLFEDCHFLTIPFQFIWQNCKDTVASAWEFIKTSVSTAIDNMKTKLTETWNAIWTVVSPILETIKTDITTAWENTKTAVTTTMENIKTAISTAWENVKTTVAPILDAIKTSISTAWENVKTAVSTAMETIKTAIITAWETPKTAVSTTMENIKTAINTALPF